MPGDQSETKSAKPTPRRRNSLRERVRAASSRSLPKPPRTTLGDDARQRAEAGTRRAADDVHGLREVQLKRLTKRVLLSIARKADLPGRSKMNKAQLARTLHKHFRTAS